MCILAFMMCLTNAAAMHLHVLTFVFVSVFAEHCLFIFLIIQLTSLDLVLHWLLFC